MVDYAVRPGNSGTQSSQAFGAVTPSDSVNLPFITRGIYVGGAGNVSVILPNSTTVVTFIGVLAGSILPIQTSRVNAALTTATNIVALY
jgi:hypothetical protein